MFDEYLANEDNPAIATMENISDFIEQTIALDPLTDVRVLVLLWKFNAVSKPAQISKKEWMAACHNLLIDSVDKLKALVPGLDSGFLDENEFKDFYKVCMYMLCWLQVRKVLSVFRFTV